MKTIQEQVDELRDEIEFLSNSLYTLSAELSHNLQQINKKYDSLLDYLDYDAELEIDDEDRDDCDDCDEESQEDSN